MLLISVYKQAEIKENKSGEVDQYLRATQLLPVCQDAAKAGYYLRESETLSPAKFRWSQVHMAIAMEKCTAMRWVQDHTRK